MPSSFIILSLSLYYLLHSVNYLGFTLLFCLSVSVVSESRLLHSKRDDPQTFVTAKESLSLSLFPIHLSEKSLSHLSYSRIDVNAGIRPTST